MRPSFHSRYGGSLRRAMKVSAAARASGAPVDEVAEQMAAGSRMDESRFDRRTLLKGMGAVAGTAAVAPMAGISLGTVHRRMATTPRVVIVGGGLAGIRCAHKLWIERNVPSTIYEWDDRLGGRVDTLRGVFANGQIVERCGEFISSEHHSMRRLAAQFGLTLGNTNAYPRHTVDTFWLNGGRYTEEMLNTCLLYTSPSPRD